MCEDVGSVIAGVLFSPMVSYPSQPRFLQRLLGRWTAMLPHLWLWWRSNGACEFEWGLSFQGIVFFFFPLGPVGVPISSQFGSTEEEAKGSYAWIFHWRWRSYTTWLHFMSNSHVTSGRSPFCVSFQEVRRSIPLSIKIHRFAFLSSSE